MVSLNVMTPDGREETIDVPKGQSLMEALRDSGFEDIQALCGGCCSCATCHVIIEMDYLAKLPPVSSDEDDLLDAVEERTIGSRLSCQIPITDALAGMTITVAPAA